MIINILRINIKVQHDNQHFKINLKVQHNNQHFRNKFRRKMVQAGGEIRLFASLEY